MSPSCNDSASFDFLNVQSIGDSREGRGYVGILPTLGPLEGMGEANIVDFLPVLNSRDLFRKVGIM